jgi:thiamine-phosphate pyrophosphorylase
MAFNFPKLYPILDSSFIPAKGRADFLHQLGERLTSSGITLLEYRNKTGSDLELISDAKVLRTALPEGKVKLILDDRADLIERLGFDGAHVDSGDVSATEARRLLGSRRIVGTFGGSDSFLPGILNEPADYFAVGPIFATTTKQTDKPPIGPEGVRRLRRQAGSDVVLTAAAGITLANAQSVLDAGANAVAVAAAIFGASDPAAEFSRWLELLR